MQKFILKSDQIGIPLFKLPKGLKNKLIDLVEAKGFSKSCCVGERFFSINFLHKIWFTHEKNIMYPELPIKNNKNPFKEIEKFFLENLK